MCLSGVANHPDPIKYCMASNLDCKANNQQQQDMEIIGKQQYDVEKNPGPRSETPKLGRIKKRKERAQRRVESKAQNIR